MDFILAFSLIITGYSKLRRNAVYGHFVLSVLLNCFVSKRFPCEQSTHFLVAGIEIDTFKEIIVLDMVTASIIPGKWLRPGLKRK